MAIYSYSRRLGCTCRPVLHFSSGRARVNESHFGGLMMTKWSGLFCAVVLAGAVSAKAATVFTESFDVDATSNWTYQSSSAGDTATDNTKNEANVFFDYSTVGIPSAPNSGGTTRGLKMEANILGSGTFGGMSI